ncbi:hypothetical protein [Magnetofaba australis]|uniref:hypothetical protein n=1 Tax=Magnetofaba australis TaxID=1472297 RepID=UPI000A19F668|nr:hypothetical protein [Magnetofaba australis]
MAHYLFYCSDIPNNPATKAKDCALGEWVQIESTPLSSLLEVGLMPPEVISEMYFTFFAIGLAIGLVAKLIIRYVK